MLYGALCLQCGSGTEDVFHPMVPLTHPISGGCGQHVQKRYCCGHVMADLSEGGELPLHTINHCGLAYLKRQFVFVQVGQSGLNGLPNIGELTLLLHDFKFNVVL
jgi:hypothetical protein